MSLHDNAWDMTLRHRARRLTRELVPGFVALLQGLSGTMTAPTFHSLTTILTGWVFARRHTITRMILATGDAAGKHFSSSHRLFSAARWSRDALGLAVFEWMRPFWGSVVMLGLDDTLARQRGTKMFGTGMHHDPLLSSRNKVITNWGHGHRPKVGRVVLGVIVELPFRLGHFYCLPILFRLSLNTKSAAKHRRAYRTRPELAVKLLKLLCEPWGSKSRKAGHAARSNARHLWPCCRFHLLGGAA